METLWRLFTNVVRFVMISIALLLALVFGDVAWFVVVAIAFVLLYALRSRTHSLFVLHSARRHHKG